MMLALTATVSLLVAALVGLVCADVLTWLTGDTTPDRLAWCRYVTSGGIFRGKS